MSRNKIRVAMGKEQEERRGKTCSEGVGRGSKCPLRFLSHPAIE